MRLKRILTAAALVALLLAINARVHGFLVELLANPLPARIGLEARDIAVPAQPAAPPAAPAALVQPVVLVPPAPPIPPIPPEAPVAPFAWLHPITSLLVMSAMVMLMWRHTRRPAEREATD
jgi:hypothetical protein